MAEPNLLTRKIGPLPGWQWGAIAVALAGGVILYRRYQAAQAAASGTSGTTDGTTTAADQATGAFGSPNPPVVIVEQPAQGSTSTGTTTTPPTPAPPKTVPKTTPVSPPTPVPPAINWANFPKMISGLSKQGGTLRSFGSVENGRITGGQVRSGAPVYALVQNAKYGPIWEQGFNPRSLPNGTRIATLPQFANLIVPGKAA